MTTGLRTLIGTGALCLGLVLGFFQLQSQQVLPGPSVDFITQSVDSSSSEQNTTASGIFTCITQFTQEGDRVFVSVQPAILPEGYRFMDKAWASSDGDQYEFAIDSSGKGNIGVSDMSYTIRTAVLDPQGTMIQCKGASINVK